MRSHIEFFFNIHSPTVNFVITYSRQTHPCSAHKINCVTSELSCNKEQTSGRRIKYPTIQNKCRPDFAPEVKNLHDNETEIERSV